MSGGTVSNHDTIIATKGTPHLAKAKPATADHCFDPTKKPVVYGDNKIYTYQLGTESRQRRSLRIKRHGRRMAGLTRRPRGRRTQALAAG